MNNRALAAVGLVSVVALLAPAANAAPAGHGHSGTPSWSARPVGVDEQFRGLAAVSDSVAWVSGEKGGVYRTTDGGAHWQDVSPAAARADGLALRDIEATSASTAVALSIGSGGDSRILRTTDGGATWTEAFRNAEPDAFYDCMAFTGRIGIAMSDSFGGYLRIARTLDGGRTWAVMPTTGMPAAVPGEFGFAASGTCVVSAQQSGRPGEFWLATGGSQPRVLHTTNAGQTWSAANSPVRAGDSAGIYSIAFRNARDGVAVGGDYTAPTDGSAASAYTRSGFTGFALSKASVGGYRSGVAFVPKIPNTVVAVGPTGSDVSTDGGRNWTTFDTSALDGIHCAHDGTCWASGPHGAVAKLTGARG